MKTIFRLSSIILFGLLIFTSCKNTNTPDTSDKAKDTLQNNPILNLISNISGEYVMNEALDEYSFTKIDSLRDVLTGYDLDSTLKILVSNFDNTRSTKSVYKEDKVMLGLICYEALTALVYYEPSDKEGDISKNWPGYVKPDADIEDLTKAKDVWQKVIADKTYIGK